jgi:hypothetical protein
MSVAVSQPLNCVGKIVCDLTLRFLTLSGLMNLISEILSMVLLDVPNSVLLFWLHKRKMENAAR